jgi:hypothetical protein
MYWEGMWKELQGKYNRNQMHCVCEWTLTGLTHSNL